MCSLFEALAAQPRRRISQAPLGLTIQMGAAGAVAGVQISNPDRSLCLVAKAVTDRQNQIVIYRRDQGR